MLEARGANAPSSPIRRRGERVAPRVRGGKHGQQASWRSPGDQPADRARSRGDGKLFDDLRRCLAKPGQEEVEHRLGIAGRRHGQAAEEPPLALEAADQGCGCGGGAQVQRQEYARVARHPVMLPASGGSS